MRHRHLYRTPRLDGHTVRGISLCLSVYLSVDKLFFLHICFDSYVIFFLFSSYFFRYYCNHHKLTVMHNWSWKELRYVENVRRIYGARLAIALWWGQSMCRCRCLTVMITKNISSFVTKANMHRSNVVENATKSAVANQKQITTLQFKIGRGPA